MNFFNNKTNKERGSATIEAIISFTGFLFVIFTILNVVNFCRAQMLISNAVDTATKEITQYSYFYKMSGLQKLSDDISNNANDGKTNLNDVLGTVDNLYSSIGTAVDNTASHAANVQNAVEEGNINLTEIQNTLAGLESDGTNIKTSMASVESAFASVQDNPLLYMKSIIAVAGNESLDALKSHVIAAPLAKSFTAKHFGKTTSEASDYLKGLGVVDGLEGMNFKMSTVFSSDSPEYSPEDVHIVVYYRLKITQLFGWATLEVPMCKESVARAWLGGDDVQKTVTPMVPAAPKEENATDDGSDKENTTEGENTEEKSNKENSSESTDLWALPKYSEDGYYMVQTPAFYDLMGETYGFEPDKNYAFLLGHNGSNAYACTNLVDTEGLILGMGEHQHSIIAENAYYEAARALKEAEKHYDPSVGKSMGQFNTYKPGEVKSLTYIVYVPENIPDDVLNDIKSNYEIGSDRSKAEAKEILGRELDVTISFVKAGGNYDYGSKE